MLEEDLIVVKFGDLVLDFGVGTLPKLFSRFYPHLRCTYTHRGATVSETLSDAEAWLIAQVLLLKSDQDFVLRLSNLPLAASLRSREDYLGKLRRMGLVFTTRLYYTRAEMLALFGPEHLPTTPRQYAQQWDLTALFHNLALIGRMYLDRQQAAVQRWQAEGAVSPRPVVTLPADYQHDIELPLVVARRIVAGEYDPRPLSSADGNDKRGPRWADRAAEQVAQASDAPPVKPAVRAEPPDAPAEILLVRTNSPLAPAEKQLVRADLTRAPAGKRLVRGDAPAEKAWVPAAHQRKNSRSSIDDDVVDDEKEKSNELIAPAVFEHFARRKAVAYTPSGRDHKLLKELLQAGYSLKQILAGIDAIFERGDNPQRFTYCASAIQDQSPACPPADPAASVARVSASPAEVVTPALQPHAVWCGACVPVELSEAAELCRAAGVTLTPETIARLRLLADHCASAAQQHQSTGSAWLTEALKRSVGRAQVDVLAYAEAILQTWIEHGPGADLRPRREGYRPPDKPKKAASGSAPHSGRQRRDFEAEARGGGPA